jgi:hypothetical protein
MKVFRIRNKITDEFLDAAGGYGQYGRKNKIYYTLNSARNALRILMKKHRIYSPNEEDWEQHFGHCEIVEYTLIEGLKHSCQPKS